MPRLYALSDERDLLEQYVGMIAILVCFASQMADGLISG
jgi:hypothetical protein